MPRSIPSARPRSAGAVPDARTGTPASAGRETRCCTVPDPQPGPPRRANSLTTPGSAASALAPRASLDRLPRRVQSTDALAQTRAPSTGDAMATRMQLLQDFRQARDRPISKEHAIAAVKLRGAAEARYDKREVSKLRPSLVKRVETRSVEFRELLAMPPDTAIAWLADHPGEGSRTLLGDLAEAHLLQSFGIDHEKFRRGIRKAAMWEQLHSTAGRVVTLAGSGVAFGTSFIPEHGVQGCKSLSLDKPARERTRLTLDFETSSPTILCRSSGVADRCRSDSGSHFFLGHDRSSEARAVESLRSLFWRRRSLQTNWKSPGGCA
jgi:hypothetical protein